MTNCSRHEKVVFANEAVVQTVYYIRISSHYKDDIVGDDPKNYVPFPKLGQTNVWRPD